VNQHTERLCVPLEVAPNVGVALPQAVLAKLILNVGEPNVIGPAVTTDR
jgi:hypothetical protein